jgi:hypothetical protein
MERSDDRRVIRDQGIEPDESKMRAQPEHDKDEGE